ncbi:hypothetical protein HG537_0A01450 [Torulaspora globosa]|uniref:MINDY deubiquitinase domain-containing protein n=1 Tax=Torulaspora globosa TaxID=48254 RepID=A0A7H9HJ22_9SACH|nr:hypothetical protein HG537_0A01450 [Torulaspora sp. CBS 2947]
MDISFSTKSIQINGSQHKILLQNRNGPCALLALANVLLIAPQHAAEAQELIYLVSRNESVALQDLVQVLANIGIQNQHGADTDVSQLLQLLPQLHTGLNINPKFNGSFEDGVEMSIFRLYNVAIVHGWIIDSDNDPVVYGHVSKYSYEDAQKVLVEAYEVQRNNLLVENADQVLEDASYIRSFFARSATQLTEYGLRHLQEVLVEKSFAVLFRNDHFSTIYKNNGQLFTLVTDLGFKDRADVVWQALKSVNGSQDTFYTGAFIPTSLERTRTSTTQNQPDSVVSNPFSDRHDSRGPATTELQQIEDDELLARRLQEQEDREAVSSIQRRQDQAIRKDTHYKDKKQHRKDGTKRAKKLKLKQCIIM